MIAHVLSNGYHMQLAITADDIEELVYRCGWTIIDGSCDGWIEGITTPEAQEAIERLQAKEYADSCGGGRQWWTEREISRVPALTPDM